MTANTLFLTTILRGQSNSEIAKFAKKTIYATLRPTKRHPLHLKNVIQESLYLNFLRVLKQNIFILCYRCAIYKSGLTRFEKLIVKNIHEKYIHKKIA